MLVSAAHEMVLVSPELGKDAVYHNIIATSLSCYNCDYEPHGSLMFLYPLTSELCWLCYSYSRDHW
jgi:hypothetical protein